MNQTVIFWPMIAQAFLTFVAYSVMYRRRVGAVMSGAAKLRQFERRGEEPAASETAASNVLNQFELPVLFYAVVLALYVTNGVSYVAVTLAWLFVISRCVHASVHMGSNKVLLRRNLFMVGFAVVVVLWLWFALHIAGLV